MTVPLKKSAPFPMSMVVRESVCVAIYTAVIVNANAIQGIDKSLGAAADSSTVTKRMQIGMYSIYTYGRDCECMSDLECIYWSKNRYDGRCGCSFRLLMRAWESLPVVTVLYIWMWVQEQTRNWQGVSKDVCIGGAVVVSPSMDLK